MIFKKAMLALALGAGASVPSVASAQGYYGGYGYARPHYGYDYDRYDRRDWRAERRYERRRALAHRRWLREQRREWRRDPYRDYDRYAYRGHRY